MESRPPRRLLPIVVFVGVAAAIVALDLWTKSAIFELLGVESLGNPPRVIRQEVITIIPGFFDLEANYNYGAFRGWFSDHTEWLAILSAAALLALALYFGVHFRGGATPSIPFTVSIALLWGGTMGNLYDRALLGAVRDWIKWYLVIGGRERVWPNFNIADSAICCGVGLLILVEIVRSWRAHSSGRRS